MDITALAEQFSGRKFGELVLLQYRKNNLQQAVAALQGTTEELPEAARACVIDWIDEVNPSATNPEFWRADCGSVFLNICSRARKKLKEYIAEPTDDHIFSMFQIVVLNFAYALHQEPQSKAFVQKSIGVGLFGRLFG
jgi:hypothetical protein